MSSILIKNVNVFSPEPEGVQDILVVEDHILALASEIALPAWLSDTRIIEGQNLTAVPGFIDAHVHITGGGGESGFSSQVPPVSFSTLVSSGITTVGGLLGTDSVTRTVASVLAKANSLYEEGLSSFIMSGGYPFPSPNITGSVRSDIAFIERIRGGKIALSDHRVAPVLAEQLLAIATDVRIGGMLRGFVGMLIMHIGSGKECLDTVFQVLDQAPYLGRHLVATHVNRNQKVLDEAVKLTRRGGYLDVTSGINPKNTGQETIKPSQAIVYALEHGAIHENILMSSDGNGSAAKYGKDGSVSGLVASDPKSLHHEFVDCVKEGLSLSQALYPVTYNVAKAFSLSRKGYLAAGADADILLLDESMAIHSVFCRGKLMLHKKELLKKGTFEE